MSKILYGDMLKLADRLKQNPNSFYRVEVNGDKYVAFYDESLQEFTYVILGQGSIQSFGWAFSDQEVFAYHLCEAGVVEDKWLYLTIPEDMTWEALIVHLSGTEYMSISRLGKQDEQRLLVPVREHTERTI